jgi:ribonuclease HII
LWAAGWWAIAGIDEAGRGAWAGPVVAAAVIFPPDAASLGVLVGRVDDSKRLTPGVRERLSGEIETCARAVGVGFGSQEEIDTLGIVAATRAAMMRAVARLAVQPDFLLIDFLTLPDLPQEQIGLPHGDALSLSIAAASIVAKVTRDRWMAGQDAGYPGYGFARHKGYGTPGHRAALERLGPSALHRRSFRPLSRGNLAEREEL